MAKIYRFNTNKKNINNYKWKLEKMYITKYLSAEEAEIIWDAITNYLCKTLGDKIAKEEECILESILMVTADFDLYETIPLTLHVFEIKYILKVLEGYYLLMDKQWRKKELDIVEDLIAYYQKIYNINKKEIDKFHSLSSKEKLYIFVQIWQ